MKHELVIHGRLPNQKNDLTIRRRGNTPFIAHGNATEEWTSSAISQLRRQWTRAALTGGLVAELRFYQGKGQRTDLDNLLAAPLDVLEKAEVLKNDYQIWALQSWRYRDPRFPRVEIVLREIEPEERKA
jgi:Holliday junction resolvase RusA-like endonuclease